MEELNKKNKVEISIKKEVQIEKELIGKIIPHRGHILFEVNLETEEIQEAMFIPATTFLKFGDKVGKQKKQVLIRDGYTYVSALNKKNALKKYKQGENGGKKLGGGLEIKSF